MDQGVDARHLSLDHRGLVVPFASDPELTARREIKLLRIEVEQLRAVERMLRAELEVLRAGRDEDRKTNELFFAYVEAVEQLFESQNYPEREAERSSGLRSHGGFSGSEARVACRQPSDHQLSNGRNVSGSWGVTETLNAWSIPTRSNAAGHPALTLAHFANRV